MNRKIRTILVVSGLAVAAMAHRSMAQDQQGQVVQQGQTPQGQISIAKDGVQQNFVIRPDGTYLVNDDGSLTLVDPNSMPAMPGVAVFSNPVNGGGNTGGPGGGNSGAGPNVAGGKGKDQSGADFAQQLQQKARQQTLDSLRKALACSDDEWAILLPKIQKIQDLQSAVMPGAPVRAPKSGADVPPSVAQLGARIEEFQKLAANTDAPDAQVMQAMASVREARNNVRADLVRARKELTGLLTPHQEVILFQRGILAD
jgi:hypothetical protein